MGFFSRWMRRSDEQWGMEHRDAGMAVRAEMVRDWAEDDDPDLGPDPVIEWQWSDAGWMRWSEMDGDHVIDEPPSTLTDFLDGHRPTPGDRFRFDGGLWFQVTDGLEEEPLDT